MASVTIETTGTMLLGTEIAAAATALAGYPIISLGLNCATGPTEMSDHVHWLGKHWGAMHGGRLHDGRATRVEAYRRGMQAILRGAGDGFILGCNHPIWASLGLIHGSRSSNDISRSWARIATTGRQNLYRNWQNFFQHHDIIITPAITISPRPWTELFPAEIDGKPTRTYFHWLALAYAVTLPGHPALSLPVGTDRNFMPFGLQIVGPRGGDALVLAVAAELEHLLSEDPATARPVPDIARLKSAPPLSASAGFLGFD